MQPGLVTVMMPAYNADLYIEQAIKSVIAQSYTNWELIIVNDGSTDRTRDVVSRFSDPRIKVVNQANGGEAAARNTALRQMKGEFLAFLDADDIYLPHHAAVGVEYLLANGDRDGVYTDGYYMAEDGYRLKPLSSRRRGPFEGRVIEEVIRGSDVFGPPVCVMLRQSTIARHGLRFDETIVIGPDWDFFRRCADVADFGYVDQHTCLYRVHQASITSQTGFRERALHLAKCRTNAVKTASFGACSLDTRYLVFYDLMVNLLRYCPEKQSEITQWPEFLELPLEVQARLFRLMASSSLLSRGEQTRIKGWIRRSRELNPADRRGALLSGIYQVSPRLCRIVLLALLVRRWGQADPLKAAPLADLKALNPPARTFVTGHSRHGWNS